MNSKIQIGISFLAGIIVQNCLAIETTIPKFCSWVVEEGAAISKATCPGRKVVMGGGCSAGYTDGKLTASYPFEKGSGKANTIEDNRPDKNEKWTSTDGKTGWMCRGFWGDRNNQEATALCCSKSIPYSDPVASYDTSDTTGIQTKPIDNCSWRRKKAADGDSFVKSVCDANEKAISGGCFVDKDVEVWLTDSGAYESNDPANTLSGDWKTSVSSPSGWFCKWNKPYDGQSAHALCCD